MNPLYQITNDDPRVKAAVAQLQSMGAPKNVTYRTRLGMFNSGPIYTVCFWPDSNVVAPDDMLPGADVPGGYECISGELTIPVFGVNITYTEMKALNLIRKG